MTSDTTPKKDVIYVDIEDDITSIIDKVKSGKSPIVALVPPKRIGVLQSVVNLKLLQRAAQGANKRVVLITSDSALTSLAAGVAIPVAKNLQSKPEIPESTSADTEEEDVINGDELPVGELAAAAVVAGTASDETLSAKKAEPLAATAAAKAPKKGSKKVPNFDAFRKKLFIGIGAGVALIIFLVWAIAIAPHATVAITAQTNLVNIDQVLQLKPNATADPTQNVLPATVQQTKKTSSVDFDATGKKNVGDKASGTVKFSNSSSSAVSVPAGTKLKTSGGLVFVTDGSVTVPAATLSFGCSGYLCPGTGTIDVTASEGGTDYNGASGSVSGAPGGMSASLTSTTSGGTDKTATVVTQEDVDKAKQQLQTQDANTVKTDLKKQFGSDMIVIDESFKADAGDPVSSPAVDQEATKAKLTVETTYTLVGVKRSDLKANFDAYLKQQLAGKSNQKVYDSGDGSVSFSQFTEVDGGYTVKADAQAQVGPVIDENSLKQQIVGKRAGEIQQQLVSVEGVEDVNTTFFPFWVNKAPSADKITIKFVLKNESN